jgi:hypothetical protein
LCVFVLVAGLVVASVFLFEVMAPPIPMAIDRPGREQPFLT